MKDSSTNRRRWIACVSIAVIALQAPAAWSQQTRPTVYGSGGAYAPNAATPATAPASAGAEFKQEEIEQIVAPIALYPDSLLSQVLMASTYPVEIVQAERWVKNNTSIKGDALAKSLEAQPWDPSVKSLTNFPDVLTMMSEKLDWTVKLGDAFIAQQAAVMETVQKLRSKAQAQGNLKSNEQQKVIVEAPPAPTATQPATTATQIIKIEPTNPQVIYVPTYNPTVVYGAWAYPAYPPYYYYPPSYNPAAAAAVSFGVGLAVGAAWGYAWGGCNWGHNDVDIDINRNTNINNANIDRSKYKAQMDQNRANRGGERTGTGNRSSFQHDPSHRGGVSYRDQGTAQKFGGASSAQAAQARDAYRGRAETGRQDIARGGADSYRSGSGAGGTAARDTSGRTGGSSANRPSGSSNRPSQTGTNSGAFGGAGSSGSATRSQSQRGQTSRASSSGGGARSAPARSSGGGGARGGGGGRGGGGRR